MGFARLLADRIDLASLTPQADLASTKYCLANPGREYLVYQPQRGARSLSVRLESGTYAIEWTDITSGRTAKADDLRAAAGNNTLESPFDGPSMLHLTRAR